MFAFFAGIIGVVIESITALGPFVLAIWAAVKTYFATFLIQTLLVVVLYNFVVDILTELLQVVTTQITNASSGISAPSALQLAGVGAYLAQHLLMAQCLSFAITILVAKFVLRKIPLIKW